jgi:hypothetical protein
VDETDSFLDGTHSVKVARADAFNLARLRLLNSKTIDERLSLDETRAVTAHLWNNFPTVVSLLTENQLHRLIAETPVSVLPTATQELSTTLPTELMYKKGVLDDVCTLILSGKVTALVGADEFRSEVSSWGLLAAGALTNPDYSPDFSAFVSTGPCRCIRITRARYSTAVDASTFERTQQPHATCPPYVPVDQDIASVEPKASRKYKLLTALRAVDNDSNHKDVVAKESTCSVAFAEPGSLSQARCIRAKTLLTATSLPNNPSTELAPSEADSSRFEFIGSPSSRRRSLMDEK